MEGNNSIASLEQLQSHRMKKNELNWILECLLNQQDLCFQQKLKTMEFSSSEVNGNQLKTLLLETVPKFSNISKAHLRGNNIHIVQSIVERIVNDNNGFVVSMSSSSSSILCTLDLRFDPIILWKS